MDKGYGTDMTYELMKCLVRIDRDVANVLMVATVDAGKVEKLEMRYNEFENHSTDKGNGTH